MTSDATLFPTITGAHWRRSIAMGRARVNRVAAQIRSALTKPLSSTAQGLDADTAPEVMLGADAGTRVVGGLVDKNSCAVGIATAGRDRRNFSVSTHQYNHV